MAWTQLTAGKDSTRNDSIWHTDLDGKYWIGHLYHRTPAQLLAECKSVIEDLYKNHPELLEYGTK